jgi:copper chaperone CopZ
VATAGDVNRYANIDGSPPSARFPRMTSILTISGMVAVHSKRAVFTALSGVPGVTSAEVELGRAVVEHHAGTPAESLIEAVALAGVEVIDIRNERRLPLG